MHETLKFKQPIDNGISVYKLTKYDKYVSNPCQFSAIDGNFNLRTNHRLEK